MDRQTITRESGAYVLTGADGAVRGSLAADRRLRRGTITTGAGVVPVESPGLRRRAAWAGPEREPLVRLDPERAAIPGLGGVRWAASRDRGHFYGVLTADGVHVGITMPAGGRGPLLVEAEGDWPGRDLAVLTAAFALLARRRADTMLTAALVSAATGGAR
ncbi:hypothetical protein Dvina_31395 [Dactylosporangium vinaceum]|uniref:Uncharacterized protein n=1 Tax=Dactylosporangium vinaceum TaxID=53362 RepID=A0ABV5LZA1_9ACTN|nr:hypothetical protein [Dactylosporangium vinaceum]UAB92808.1 hypothetical protein Dvina_31395 [Dactylosporangium vinaceum]